MRILVILLFVFSLQKTCSLYSQDIFPPPSETKKIKASYTSESISIDGNLQESSWQNASVAQGFRQVEPYQGEAPAFDTEVRLLYDADNLYIGAYCRDTADERGLRVPNMQRDFDASANDLFGITIDAFNDKRNCLAFLVTPFGAQRDVQVFDDLLFDNDWDAIWRVRTSFSDSGWFAEIAIPWASLRYRDSSTQWGINFLRVIRHINQITAWSLYPRAYSVYRMTYAGELNGIQPPSPSLNLRLQPYTTVRTDRATQGATTQFGGEAKWAVTPNLVADLTINTDFAQADVDRQVVNLRRFSVFFPERRQFFLEGASLFSVGLPEVVEPFFSRKIGLTETGTSLPIDAGVRIISRAEERSYGGMFVRQREQNNFPASTFGVARFIENLGSGNRIGAMAMVRHDGSVNNTDSKTTTAWVADGFWRVSDPFAIRGMMSYSTTPEDSKQNGYAGFVQARYATNSFVADIKQAVISPDYSPPMGQISRPNIWYTFPGAYIVYRPKWMPTWLRSIEPGINLYLYHGVSDGKFQESLVELFPIYLVMQDGGIIFTSLELNAQRLTVPFTIPTGNDISIGDYSYQRVTLNYSSDQSAWLSGTAKVSAGGYFDGTLHSLDTRLRYAPLPNISLSVNYLWNEFIGVGNASAYGNTHLIAPELRLALNPRLQFIGFWQYNTAADLSTWNMRLAWEFAPLSYLYIVLNDQRSAQTGDPLQQQAVIKLTYLWQM